MDAAIYLPALITYLVVPDAAGAVEYPTLPNKKRYPQWFDENISPNCGMTGEIAWGFRNAIMHATRSDWRQELGFSRVDILLPTPPNIQIHGNVSEWPGIYKVYTNDLETMANYIEEGTSSWLAKAEADEEKLSRMRNFLQIRPALPSSFGLPAIG